jgi:MFS family permease
VSGPRFFRLRHVARALHGRNYRVFWMGQLVSLTGSWMQDVAQSWLVLQLTDSPLALGAMITLRFLPSMVLSMFAGVLADRIPKRRLLIITQTVMLVQAAAMAVLTSLGIINMGQIYALTLVRGLADAFDMPVRIAFIAELVAEEDLPNAVGLNSAQFNLARIAGPALGGVATATIGVAACFYLNAVSFLAVIGALLMLSPAAFHSAPRPVRGRVFAQLAEGMRYSVRTPDIALVLLVVLAIGTFGYNFSVMLPLVAKYVLNSGSIGLGMLTTALGVGSLVAALSAAYRSRPSPRLLLASAAAFTVLLAALGFSRWQAVTLFVLVALGVCGITFWTASNTTLQLSAPPELRGRVMGIYSALFIGTTPVGSFLIGWLAERFGVQSAILSVAGVCAAGVFAGVIYYRRGRGLERERVAGGTSL